MTGSHFFYQLLIKPLEILFEVVYRYAMIYVDNSGIAIIVMSLVMNFLLLPLYRRADHIQEDERRLEKAMEAGVAHIKQTYHGDERFMMLQTYYRQHRYKPWFILKGLVPLMLEVPFFIAAYHFLSNLKDLNGASFGPLSDLGAPDRLLTVFGTPISVMPILMTVINIISSMIYTKGLSRRDKLQLYGMALVFLVLLYNSPSGLVLYWTLNNLFSLVKNIICRIPDYRRVLRITMSALGAGLLVLALFFYPGGGRMLRVLLIVIALLLQIPIMKPRIAGLLPEGRGEDSLQPDDENNGLYFLEAVFLTLLTGVLSPSAVIQSSPTEFVFHTVVSRPLVHVLDAFLLASGVFLIWMGVFYGLANPKGKRVMTVVLWLLCLTAVANYMFFGTRLGTLSSTLVYDLEPYFSRNEIAVNLAVMAGIMTAGYLIFKKSRKSVRAISALLIAAVTGMSVFNIVSTQRQLSENSKLVIEKDAHCEISREGKNVIVIMLDRAIGSYIPYLFQEKPELREQLDGFTWYPNTLSYGGHTVFGAPPLFGGYEYTPEEMNKRDSEKLVDKHDEALKVMPVLFQDAGYDVTLLDPPYGYQMYEDVAVRPVFEDYQNVHAFEAERGQYFSPDDDFVRQYQEIWERNFFCFSLMKCSPLFFQPYLYQNGSYFNNSFIYREDERISCSGIVNWNFANSFSVLESMPEIAGVTDEKKNTLLLLCNSSTHEPTLLEEPSYTISPMVDNRVYDREHTDRFTADGQTLHVESLRQMQHYQIDMAALLELGKWFDDLRAAGCYDNCRIILVSDHGAALNQVDSMIFGQDWGSDAMMYNPLLMVKDFDSHGFKVSDSFMTNADTPVLAMRGLITDPINPFTGNPISDREKNNDELHVFASDEVNISGGHTIYPKDRWYAVSEDVRDGDNWKLLGEW